MDKEKILDKLDKITLIGVVVLCSIIFIPAIISIVWNDSNVVEEESETCDNLVFENNVCDEDCTTADLSDYEGFENIDGIFLEIDFSELTEKIENEETFFVYLGFSTCPWCIDLLPILNEVGISTNTFIYYVDVRPDDEDLRVDTNEDYVFLQNIVSEYLSEDDNKIYVPAVLKIENGIAVDYHIGTLTEHDATERDLTETEQEELLEYFMEFLSCDS